jgi:A/G-specific adenine glycosylase
MTIKKLISWSQKEFSHLPWRKDRSLYKTLVSEIMLQQTTVGTVKNFFDDFILKFSDINSLAIATEEEVLVAWKGLGYYRRAKNLRKIAQAIASDFKGVFPKDMETLQAIPGIGPYTASALLSIGMNRRALAVDANLERVIARLLGLKIEKGPKLQKEIYSLFENKQIFNSKELSPRDLNEALMDLGRTYCQARKTSCDLCFLRAECKAFQDGTPLKYPLDQKNKSKSEHEVHLLRCYIVKNEKLLVYKKSETEWLSGQYEVPSFVFKTSDKKFMQYPGLKAEAGFSELKVFKTGITKYKIQNYVIRSNETFLKSKKFERKLEWKSLQDPKSNFSTATLKGLKHI